MKKYIYILCFIPWILIAQQVDEKIPLDLNNKPVSLLYAKDALGNYVPVRVDSNGAVDVSLQDQTTDPIISNFNRIDGSTTLSDNTEIDESFIIVADTTGAGNSELIFIFNPVLLRFSKMSMLSINEDTVFVDTPLDVEYPIGSFVDFTTIEMAVDADTTSQTFGLRGVSPSPVGITVDITRIIFTIIMTTAPEFTDFGDIADGLTNGLILRKRDGRNFNIFNIKTNQELVGLMYDMRVYEGDKVFNTNAITGRLTFGGQSKIGVVIRLNPGEDLEFIIQDDLTSLISMRIIAEGHIVED
jgi:hypothetical protein